MTDESSRRSQLQELRVAIDSVDSRLLKLLNERMALAKRVGELKAGTAIALFDPGREEAICRRLAAASEGPLHESSLRAIYREILAASRLLQYPLQVAFPGPPWTFAQVAAVSLFGHSARYLPLATLEEVFAALVKGRVHVALVPVENSLEGGVGRSLDLLHEQPVQVVRECYLEISHCLASRAGALDRIERLYAQPQAIAQCRRWILEHLPRAEWRECPSTAQAAQLARQDPHGAALCNLYAAHHYGLEALQEALEDQPGNVTRFFALGRDPNPPTGCDKSSILFGVRDQPGALHCALAPLTRFQLNMTRIESRPNRLLPWQYLFYADIEGHRDDPDIRAALDALREQVAFFKVLGSYPKSDPLRPIRFDREKVRDHGLNPGSEPGA